MGRFTPSTASMTLSIPCMASSSSMAPIIEYSQGHTKSGMQDMSKMIARDGSEGLLSLKKRRYSNTTFPPNE